MLLSRTLFKDFTMPTGDPDDWDVEQDACAHYLAREFAREYLVDWDGVAALKRLGCYDDHLVVVRKARNLLQHPMITTCIQETIREFGKQMEITPSSIMALLWAEANDRGYGSSSRSRIAALKELREHMGLSNGKQGTGAGTDDGSPKGMQGMLEIVLEGGAVA